MEGYEVITSDDCELGHVTGTVGDYLLVEHGTLRKTRRPVPKAFAHADDTEEVVRLTVSKEVVTTAPKADGDDLQEQAVAEHYGLAAAYAAPETLGAGEVLPDDPARTAEDDARRAGIPTATEERLQVRSGDDPAAQQEASSPGLLGSHTPED